MEERLGAQVVLLLAPEDRRIDDPNCQKAIEGIAHLLMETEQSSPYNLHIILKRDPVINAFAAPGGYIVIHDGLLRKTKSPEELAAVLAHEIQHILQRHSTRAILRELSIGMLFSALSGDAGGLHYALETVRTLGGLRFRRQDEAEADQKGLQMLQKAKIDPKGMVAFFETLEKEVGDIPRFLSYVINPSAHRRTHWAVKTDGRPDQLRICCPFARHRLVRYSEDVCQKAKVGDVIYTCLSVVLKGFEESL